MENWRDEFPEGRILLNRRVELLSEKQNNDILPDLANLGTSTRNVLLRCAVSLPCEKLLAS